MPFFQRIQVSNPMGSGGVITALGLLVILALPQQLWSQSDRAIVKKVANFWARYRSIQATFSMGDGSQSSLRGMVRYAYPGKIRVDFSEPAGRKIVTNGRYLWVISSSGVGRQDLYARSLSGGLSFLLGYSNMAVLRQNNGYMIRLRSNSRYWRKVVVSASKDYVPRSISMTSKNGSTRKITISNVKKGISFPGNIFDYRVPSSVQLVENPLNLK